MNSEKKYTVIELAGLIEVPRTTINDWLNRYAQYIVTQTQGKRKVYPESALAILREIAEMRNAGKAFPEIETELGERHPIKAEPVPPVQEHDPSENSCAEPNPEAAHNEGEFAVIARRQSEEIGRLIGDSFRNMDQRIQELENISRHQRKMSLLWFSAFLIFLAILVIGAFAAFHFISIAKRENTALLKQNNENTEKIADLKAQSVSLIAGSKAFQENVKRLEKELNQQKKDFDKNIEQERQRLTALHQAQARSWDSDKAKIQAQLKAAELRLALEKEKFAAERLKLLQDMKKDKEKQNIPEKKADKKKTAKKEPAPKKTVSSSKQDSSAVQK